MSKFHCKQCGYLLTETNKSNLPGISHNLKCENCLAIYVVFKIGGYPIKKGLTQVLRKDRRKRGN